MTKHVHLLVTGAIAESIPRVIIAAERRYQRYINHSDRRTGTRWDSRYKSSLMQAAMYLLLCQHDIETNPVRATMVADPAQYRFVPTGDSILCRGNDVDRRYCSNSYSMPGCRQRYSSEDLTRSVPVAPKGTHASHSFASVSVALGWRGNRYEMSYIANPAAQAELDHPGLLSIVRSKASRTEHKGTVAGRAECR